MEETACKMPTEAEEDWMTAVRMVPASTPRMGLERAMRMSANWGRSRRGAMAFSIDCIPMKRMPSPATICP